MTGPAVKAGALRGCSSMAEHQLPKLTARVRFPSPAHRGDRESFRRGPRKSPGGSMEISQLGFRPVHISKAARLLVEINGAIESVPASAHIQGR